MISVEKKEKCCGCSGCANICPKRCISMIADDEGFLYPQVDTNACVNCGMCEGVCPEINNIEPHDEVQQAFACKSRDEAIRAISSSGGMFYFLGKEILSNGGVVVAPLFDEEYRLKHCIISTERQLMQAIGSKYVQSEIGSIYKDVKALLEANKEVMFSGTPCQIVGLKNYLGKRYERLVIQDIICHGVPSPMIWDKHVKFLKTIGNSIESLSFRDKKNGWRMYSLKATFENGDIYCVPSYKEPYLKTYSRDLTSRPSCFTCPFKGIDRNSDITLGDFWGIENICPELDDNKGITLAIIHTLKGMQLFNGIRDKMVITAVETDKALEYNGAALKPIKPSPNRKKFFVDLSSEQYANVMARYSAESMLTKMKRTFKGIIHR